MKIIDHECLGCACFSNCTTDIMKGSIMCSSKRIQAKQTKKEMLQKMYDIEKASKTKGGNVLEMLGIENDGYAKEAAVDLTK